MAKCYHLSCAKMQKHAMKFQLFSMSCYIPELITELICRNFLGLFEHITKIFGLS